MDLIISGTRDELRAMLDSAREKLLNTNEGDAHRVAIPANQDGASGLVLGFEVVGDEDAAGSGLLYDFSR